MHAQRDLSFGRKTSSENVILLLKLSDLMTAIKMGNHGIHFFDIKTKILYCYFYCRQGKWIHPFSFFSVSQSRLLITYNFINNNDCIQ